MSRTESLHDLLELIASMAAPGGTILDVGCGDGALVAMLRERGYDACGIDLKEPQSPHCTQIALEDFTPKRPFDAVVARLSLHHTANIGVAFRRLRELLANGGHAFVEEFGWERMDRRTLAWARANLEPPGPDPHVIAFASGTVDDAFTRWTTRYGELHSSASMLAAADASFRREHMTAIPYLSWLSDLPNVLPAERAAITGGAISALGFRYAGRPL